MRNCIVFTVILVLHSILINKISYAQETEGAEYSTNSSSKAHSWSQLNRKEECPQKLNTDSTIRISKLSDKKSNTRNTSSFLTPLDFDNDGISDIGTTEDQRDNSPNELVYQIIKSSNKGKIRVEFGNSGDGFAPGDYNGDGFWDLGYIRENNKLLEWHILTNKGDEFSGHTTVQFGETGAIGISGCDFDGNSATDLSYINGRTLSYMDLLSSSVGSLTLGLDRNDFVVGTSCINIDEDSPSELVILTKKTTRVRKKVIVKYRIRVFDHNGLILAKKALKKLASVVGVDLDNDGKIEPGYIVASKNRSKLYTLRNKSFLPTSIRKVSKSTTCNVFYNGILGNGLCVMRSKRLSNISFPSKREIIAGVATGSDLLLSTNIFYTGGINFDDPEKICSKIMSAHDGANGFLWKASDVHGGNLVVVFPQTYRSVFSKVYVIKNSKNYGNLSFSGFANGNRQHWRISKPAKSFPNESIVVAARKSGNICWKIGRSDQRND